MHKEGNKKTIFANLADICKKMHRQDEHVIAFLFAELGTSGSVDGSHRLVIKGRYTQKNMENVLRKYIGEFRTPFPYPGLRRAAGSWGKSRARQTETRD